MTAQAGWYPDPSGNVGKLRYWNGSQWTSDFMDAPGTQDVQNGVTVINATQNQDAAQTIVPIAGAGPDNQSASTQAASQTTSYQQPNTASFQGGYQNPAGQQQTYQQPNYGTPVTPATVMNPDGSYVVEGTDSTLRLVAFVFYMLTIASCALMSFATLGLSLICLAWLIPMGVRCWGIYKGTKPNTVAFGVCTILFSNMIAGILLLISKKDA